VGKAEEEEKRRRGEKIARKKREKKRKRERERPKGIVSEQDHGWRRRNGWKDWKDNGRRARSQRARDEPARGEKTSKPERNENHQSMSVLARSCVASMHPPPADTGRTDLVRGWTGRGGSWGVVSDLLWLGGLFTYCIYVQIYLWPEEERHGIKQFLSGPKLQEKVEGLKNCPSGSR
jgi:hypothetical protein